tara:strand:- start:509 stop:1180 length:672 start_codon:yes stop_codon:yes gene_type:complete
MNFLNRLKFFLIGISLGLFLVFSIFKEREWSWLPENKIKKFLLDNPIKINLKKSELSNINDDFSRNIFNVIIYGDVVFSQSTTNTNPKKYLIKYENDSISVDISFKDSSSLINSFNSYKFCQRNDDLCLETTLNMDDLNFFLMLEKLEKKYNKKFNSDMKKYNLNNLHITKNLKTYKNDWKKSNIFKLTNPNYQGTIEIEGNKYEITMEKGNNKLRFKTIIKL